jgi:hypothetical protein
MGRVTGSIPVVPAISFNDLAIVMSVEVEMISTNFQRNPSASREPSAGFANDTSGCASDIVRY